MSLVLVTAVLGAANAAAGPTTLDQSQLDANLSIAIQPGNYISQTFVPQTSGFLSGVEVSLDMHPLGQTVRAEVWSTNLRVGLVEIDPGDEGAFPADLVSGSVTGTLVDFTPFAIPTVSGSPLEVRFHNANGAQLAVLRQNTDDAYPAGTITFDGSNSSGDLAFKSFVAQSVPLGNFDHFQPDGSRQAIALPSTLDRGQSFTVVRSGPLQGIEMILSAPLAPTDDLRAELFRLGTRGATSLGAVTVTAASINSAQQPLFLQHAQVLATYIDLSPLGVTVTSGEAFDLRFQTNNTAGFYNARMVADNVYSGGTMTDNGSQSGGDLAFKLFVDGDPPLFRDGFEAGDLSAWSP